MRFDASFWSVSALYRVRRDRHIGDASGVIADHIGTRTLMIVFKSALLQPKCSALAHAIKLAEIMCVLKCFRCCKPAHLASRCPT